MPMPKKAGNAPADLARLKAAWVREWPGALATWSRFVQLAPPRWCLSRADEQREGLAGSFAAIRLADHAVVVSLVQVRALGLDRFARQILAHEIGHHVLAPADLADHARLAARTRAALPGRAHQAGFIANLYTDLLINDRLQRIAGLDLGGVYRTIGKEAAADPLWTLYMRIYEILWGLPARTLTSGAVDSRTAGDAWLGARLVRVYAREWLDGAGRFAALCLRYLQDDDGKGAEAILAPLMDAERAGEGETVPDGLAEVDPAETDGAVHPALDPAVNEAATDDADDSESDPAPGAGGEEKIGGRKSDYRSPDEYAELMKGMGVTLSRDELVIRYYRERARPHLIPYPSRRHPRSTDPIPEGVTPWDIGSPVSAIDWIGTLTRSPTVIPGVTTVQTRRGRSPGGDPEHRPTDLYLGIDCSGSMPNPKVQVSFPVIAGTIMALSARRAGAKVMAVLSGEPGRYSETGGFTADEHEILKVLTGYLGTGYAFGVSRLEATYPAGDAQPADRSHILIITDGDIFSMLGTKDGWKTAGEALERAGGGGTMVLHQVSPRHPDLARLTADGWAVHLLTDWESLVRFARAFSRRRYGEQ
jgi:hypothetical protein